MKILKHESQLLDDICHRAGITMCPECDYDGDLESWGIEHATHIILDPQIYLKSDSIIMISPCPKCGELSWVHQRIDGILSDASRKKIPESTIVKIKKERIRRIRNSVDQLYNSPCMTCANVADLSFNLHFRIECDGRSGRPYDGKCNNYKSTN